MLRQFTNNATTTLAAGISATATNLSVVAGTGALFPNPSAGQSFSATLVKNGTPSIYEIILCTSRSNDTFNVIARGQQGTTALTWNAGDTVALLPTSGDLAQFTQFDDLQKQLGNYATDVGSANAYSVTLTPALTAHVTGMPIRWKAVHANTGASTFNDGAGSAALVIAPGVNVSANTVVAGGVYTSTWDGTEFQLEYSPNLAPYATTASLANYATLADLAAYATLADLTPYATIAALDARTGTVKTGTFTCVAGTTNVYFSTAYTAGTIPVVVVQWVYAGADVGNVVPGSENASGFQYYNGNSGACNYIAVG